MIRNTLTHTNTLTESQTLQSLINEVYFLRHFLQMDIRSQNENHALFYNQFSLRAFRQSKENHRDSKHQTQFIFLLKTTLRIALWNLIKIILISSNIFSSTVNHINTVVMTIINQIGKKNQLTHNFLFKWQFRAYNTCSS